MKIAILGGAFDPPHLGHLIVAEQVREILKMNEVWLMPVYSHPFHKHLSPTKNRMAMTKIVESKYIKATDFEIKHNSTSYTIDTLRLLHKQRPDDEFFWCIGSDTLPDFHKWKEWEKLIKDFKIIVYPRGNGLKDLRKNVQKAFKLNNITLNISILDHKGVVTTNVSSTLVRERVASGRSIHYLVSDKIEKYIKDSKLYIKSS